MKRAVSCFSPIFIAFLCFVLFLEWPVSAQIRNPYPWPESTPEAQGIETAILENVFQMAEKMEHVDGILIVRNGFLVGERYYNGHDKYTPHLIASASKSIISALVGILLREKYIHSLDQKMLEFFPEYITPRIDPRKHDITIRHLLQMRSGFSDEDYDAVSSSWIRYAIEYLPLHVNPGEGWLYSSLGTHLLSAIITRASGLSTREFAEKYLLQPLDISVHDWLVDPQGYYTGGWGVYMTPRDMARFGYLYLNQGRVNETEIIPADFLKNSWQYSEAPEGYWTTSGVIEDAGYGYLWWMGKMGGLQAYGATGYAGQHIIVIPDLNMVVVMTSDHQGSSLTAYRQHRENFMLETFNLLLPIRDSLCSPPHAPRGVEGVMVKNRSLVLDEYMNVLSWQSHPQNQGANISGYRIYLYASPLKRYFLTEMGAGARMFWHWRQGIEKQWEYVYGIHSVTADGQESLPAMVVVKWPEEQEEND